MHRGSWGLIVGLLVAASTCAHRPVPVTEVGQPLTGDSLVVIVTNHEGAPAEMFSSAPAGPLRLGLVDPGARAQFVLRYPWLFAGKVDFTARLQNGGTIRSGHLLLAAGDVVDFVLEGNTMHPRATIRP
jgi:hypothetical protein